MSVRALQEYTRFSKYAKYLPEKKRRETWDEQVSRVFEMHREKLGTEICEILKDDLAFAEKMVRRKRVLGSQRALQFGGKPILNKHQKLYNCTMSYCDRLRFFQEAMHLLLCGCVLPDTKVLTENGIKEIQDILEGERVWSFNKETEDIELKSVIKTHDVHVPHDENIKVSGIYGNFTTSKKHPVLVLRENKWEYVPADSISLGDVIQKASFQNSSNKFDKKAYFAGAFLGNGSSNVKKCGSRRIRINGDNEELVKVFAELMEDLSGVSVKYKEDNRSIYSVPMWIVEKTLNKENPLTQTWDSLVGKLPSSKTKVIRVPEWIRNQYNKDTFLSFLSGLIDTDGYVSDGKIDISTISKKMVEDICSESTKYGIYPWVTTVAKESYCSTGFTPKNDLYRIIFSINDLVDAKDFFRHDKKSEKVKSYIKSTNKSHKRLVIPSEKIEEEIYYLELDSNNAWHFRKQIEENNTCYASYYTSRGKSFSHLLKYDIVIDIECDLDITENFKDLSVEDNNSYICGEGSYYVLHNCGIGFSVQSQHIDKLPNIKAPYKNKKIFTPEDSIEGWSDCIGVILSSYFVGNGVPFPEYQGYNVEFDLSKIRPAGAPISSGSKAPGPAGLKNSLEKISKLLNRCCKLRDKLRPIDAYDIMMHSSDAVLSGGIRRSASVCLFSPDDNEMARAKTGAWRKDNPQRGRSNNSVILVRDKTTKEDFMKFIEFNKEFGEPGFVWTESDEVVVNPCVSGDTWVMTSQGPRKAKNLLGEQFNAVINGEIYSTTKKGMFKTGTKELFSIKTKEGVSLDATKNHKIMTQNGWVELKDIKIGDKIVIHNHKEFEWMGEDEEENFDNGWLLGNLVGDGIESRFHMSNLAINKIEKSKFNKGKEVKHIKATEKVGKRRIHSMNLGEFASRYGIEKNSKTIGDRIEESSSEMYRGFLQGYFDADGCVQGNLRKGISIRLDSTSEINLKAVQRMLLRLGIVSKIYRNRKEEGYRLIPDGKGGKRRYYCQAVHELVISNDSIRIYKERIGFSELDKIEKLNKLLKLYRRRQNRSKYWVTVSDIEKKGTEEVYDCTVPIVHAFDGNGMYIHNCVEIATVPKLILNDELRKRFSEEIKLQGNNEYLSGWNFCNLCEINVKKCRDEEDFLDVCRAAAIIGTIQASYSTFKYLGPITEEIVRAEALLGVSMTGMADNPDIAFNPSTQRKGARLILEINERVADIIGINRCARSCCVKPAGSTSCVLGTASGIHPHHAKRYFRRVQANKLETPLQYFQKQNPDAIEESVWSNNNTDVVITFLCEVPDGAKTKNQVSAITLLENVKLTQQNWVEYGTRHETAIYPWLRHNVSNTISIKNHEWQDIANHIYRNKKWYAGISMLPVSGDKDYPQAPFTAIMTTTEMVREYGDGSMFASGLIVDGLRVFEDNLWAACDCILGIGEILKVDRLREKIATDYETNGTKWKKEGLSPESPDKLLLAWLKHNVKNYDEKVDWVRRANQFAKRYFEDDVRKMTYCLKDVTNWKKWLDLSRTYVDVDWSGCFENEYGNLDDYGGGAGEACSGGACELGELGYSMRDSLQKKEEE